MNDDKKYKKLKKLNVKEKMHMKQMKKEVK